MFSFCEVVREVPHVCILWVNQFIFRTNAFGRSVCYIAVPPWFMSVSHAIMSHAHADWDVGNCSSKWLCEDKSIKGYKITYIKTNLSVHLLYCGFCSHCPASHFAVSLDVRDRRNVNAHTECQTNHIISFLALWHTHLLLHMWEDMRTVASSPGSLPIFLNFFLRREPRNKAMKRVLWSSKVKYPCFSTYLNVSLSSLRQ